MAGVLMCGGSVLGCSSNLAERPKTILKDPNATDTDTRPELEDTFPLGGPDTDPPEDTGPYSQPSVGTFVPVWYSFGATFGYSATSQELVDYTMNGTVYPPQLTLYFVDQDWMDGVSNNGICTVVLNGVAGSATSPDFVHDDVWIGLEFEAGFTDFTTDCLNFSALAYPTPQHFLDQVLGHPWGAGVGVMDPVVELQLSPFFTPEDFELFGGGGGYTDVQVGAFGQIDTINADGFAMGGYSLAEEMDDSGVVALDASGFPIPFIPADAPETARYESVPFYFFAMQYL